MFSLKSSTYLNSFGRFYRGCDVCETLKITFTQLTTVLRVEQVRYLKNGKIAQTLNHILHIYSKRVIKLKSVGKYFIFKPI